MVDSRAQMIKVAGTGREVETQDAKRNHRRGVEQGGEGGIGGVPVTRNTSEALTFLGRALRPTVGVVDAYGLDDGTKLETSTGLDVALVKIPRGFNPGGWGVFVRWSGVAVVDVFAPDPFIALQRAERRVVKFAVGLAAAVGLELCDD